MLGAASSLVVEWPLCLCVHVWRPPARASLWAQAHTSARLCMGLLALVDWCECTQSACLCLLDANQQSGVTLLWEF